MLLAFAAMGAWMAPVGYAAAGFMVGGILGSQLMSSGMQIPDNVGPRLGDSQIQASTEGASIPILWGQHAISGNVIWRQSPWEEISHTTSQEVGKGGGSSTVSSTRFSYRGSLAVLLCTGPIPEGAIKKIWANDILLDHVTMVASGKLRIYLGTESQLPDPAIEVQEGIGNVPAFRGLAYIVFDNFDFDQYGNTLPQFRFELEGL